MAKNYCNLCGKEFGYWNSSQITFFNIDGSTIKVPPYLNEPVCIDCARSIQALSNGMRKQSRSKCESILETRDCVKYTRNLLSGMENKQIASFIEIAVQLEAWESLVKECDKLSDKINEHCRLEKKECFAYDLKTKYNLNNSEYKKYYYCIDSENAETKWLLVAGKRLLVANKDAIPDLKGYDINYEELILNNIKSIFDLQGLKKLYEYVPDFSKCWDYDVDVVPFENIAFFKHIDQDGKSQNDRSQSSNSYSETAGAESVISGPIGFILTSIASSKPLEDKQTQSENKMTILVYNYNGKAKLLSLPDTVYNFLKENIPEKESKN